MRAWVVALPVALLAVLAAGCGGPGPTADPPWHGRDLSEPGWHNMTLPGHSMFEAEYPLEAGQKLKFDWVVPERWGVIFDIHHHVGEEVVYDRYATGAEGLGVFTAEEDTVYSVTWTNQNTAPLEVWIRVPSWRTAGLQPFDDGHQH